MEDIRPYGMEPDDTLRIEPHDAPPPEREAAPEDELPFEIPRD